jgi:hypothetical protein
MNDFVILLLGAVACVALGIAIGHKLSHDKYGHMVDIGELLFKTEDGKWDGIDDAMYNAKDFLEGWNGRPESEYFD